MKRCVSSGKKIVILSVWMLGLGMLVSCSSGTRSTRGTSPAPPPEVPAVDESFDPFTLQDDDLEFPEPRMPEPVLPPGRSTSPEPSVPTAPVNELVDGFRVQLFATRDIESATLQKKEAEYEFASDSVGVYIEFDSPLYKVRIGDCQTREEAERLLNLARSRGFSTAFIVKSKVNSAPLLQRDSFNNEPDR